MVQEIEQSHDEKVEMYMKLTKKELTEMLIESNKQLDAAIKNCTIPVVTTSYLYLVTCKYHGGAGHYYTDTKVVKFENTDDITVENMIERVAGKKHSNYKIVNVRPL